MACRPTNDPQLMSYRSFLDSFLLPSQVASSPEAERRNTEVKHLRQGLKRAFTEPGQPGEMFRCVLMLGLVCHTAWGWQARALEILFFAEMELLMRMSSRCTGITSNTRLSYGVKSRI